MKEDRLQKKVQDNLKEGEGFLDFLSQEIQESSRLKVGLMSFFSPALKEEQKRYSDFQKKYAVWVRENFGLRRELVFTSDEGIEQKKQFLAMLEDEAKTVDSLFDSWPAR